MTDAKQAIREHFASLPSLDWLWRSWMVWQVTMEAAGSGREQVKLKDLSWELSTPRAITQVPPFAGQLWEVCWPINQLLPSVIAQGFSLPMSGIAHNSIARKTANGSQGVSHVRVFARSEWQPTKRESWGQLRVHEVLISSHSISFHVLMWKGKTELDLSAGFHWNALETCAQPSSSSWLLAGLRGLEPKEQPRSK